MEQRLAKKFRQLENLGKHPAIAVPRATYARHRYSTPLFILRETLNAFKYHNGLSLSAALSFYAMFALIPMALLVFFMLSHLIVSSDYALVKLAILTSNLVPRLSNRIMIEVYNLSSHKAVWGIFGMLALLWVITPLAGALRSAFYSISSLVEAPSFIKGKIKDVLAVLGILFLFFLFTFAGLVLERVIRFLEPYLLYTSLMNSVASLLITTLLIAVFYRIFFPVRVDFRHILIGSLMTASLWLVMRPAFTLFLSVHESYGSMFGGMKSMFISIAWLYYTFAVFMLGTELIATLRKKDVLLLKGLFVKMPTDKANYLRQLMNRYGRVYRKDEYVFREGDASRDLYYIVSGEITLLQKGEVIRQLKAGEYFGEMSMLTELPRYADARVESAELEVVVISPANLQTLLAEPNVAMSFLKQMALRLQQAHRGKLA
jgi:membrane protein